MFVINNVGFGFVINRKVYGIVSGLIIFPAYPSAEKPQMIQSAATIICGEEKRWSERKGISAGYGCEQSAVRDDEAGVGLDVHHFPHKYFLYIQHTTTLSLRQSLGNDIL